jgi:tetratricopeptide (TPR) repeat protein
LNGGSDKTARALLEKGLARYGRGQIAEAIAAWREALEVDPNNDEARKLVDFVQARLGPAVASPPADVNTRQTANFPTVKDEPTEITDEMDAIDVDDDFDENRKDTNPEVDRTTEENLPSVGNVSRDRKRRDTLVSNVPSLLAQGTRSRNETPRVPRPAVVDRLEEDSAPRRAIPSSVPTEESGDSLTRPIGSAHKTPATGVQMRPTATFRTDTPLDMALTIARTRAAKMVDLCRTCLETGNVDGAAEAAEEALEEGDKAPLPGIAEVIEPARAMFEQAFAAHVGPEVAVPVMVTDNANLNTSSFDHKTGFLLSCIDGSLAVSTLLDISGMGRFDSLRTLSRLLRRRIISFG